MKTGDKYLNIALKRFLSHNRLKENFLEYLQDGQVEHLSRIFPSQGLFTYPVTITKSAAGDATIDFSPDPTNGTDGIGHILEATGASVLTNVTIPNTAAKDYWFALHYTEKPSGMYLNPRTGLSEYDTWEEQIGRSAAPTSVTDLGGGNIQFDVTSVTDVGTIDYSGMTVTVWLNNPQTSDAAIAIETITITNPVATNLAVMTSGDSLGQATISTTASDYMVCLNGIVWEEVATGAGNPFASDYIILGYVTGNTTTVVTSDQVDLSAGGSHTLQNAYSGAGLGAGRNITADYQAVNITQQNSGFHDDDIVQAALRLSKDGDGSVLADDYSDYEVGMDVTGRVQMYAGTLCRSRLVDEAATELQKDEPITFSAAGNTITGTRTPNFTLPTSTNSAIIPDYDLVEISGSTSDDGVYLITTVAATILTVKNLDGTAVSFTAAHGGSALANVYRPVSRLAGGGAGAAGEMSSGLQIVTLNDFYAENGGATTQGSGVDIVVPTGARDADYIIRQDRNATDTFIVDAAADVITTGDYKYAAARTFYQEYNSGDFEIDHAYGIILGGTTPYVAITADPGTNDFAFLPLNDIPDGAIITEIEAIVDPNATPGHIRMHGRRITNNWSTGVSVGNPMFGGATFDVSSGTALQVLAGTTPGISLGTMDHSQYSWQLYFTGDGTTDPTAGKVYDVRVTYTMVDVIP